MKKKLHLEILFLLIISTACLTAFPQTVFSGDSKWSRVNIPSNGVSGQWVLAEGSDLHSLALASDGTLYCSANPVTTPYRLFKSTDGGASWIYTGRVEDTIVDIALIPDHPNLVYYATIDTVFKSVDAGGKFEQLGANPGESGTGNIQITSLDVIAAEGIYYLAVGVRDTDPDQFGGVYSLDESQSASWRDCGIGDYDVLKIASSPNFAQDRQLIAIGTNEQDTVISSGTLEGGWGLEAGEARLPGLIPIAADIAFPDDYDSAVISGKYIQFISLNTGVGQGGVYCIRGQASPAFSTITELTVDGLSSFDISSLAVRGNASEAKLLAISADSPQTYFSEDAGITWENSAKPPGGDSGTGVLMAVDFATSGLAYAITSGAESAFSVSRDKGATWCQTGLIDTRISTILDLGVSPDYAQDGKLYLLTADIQNSLWYSSDRGFDWQRIYYTSPAELNRINLVLLSPEFSDNGQVLLAGTSSGIPVIWKSENNGGSFSQYASVDPDTGNQVNIDTWTISPSNVLFVGGFDGDHGIVYQTGPDSLSYVDKGVAGSQIINSLSFSPDYVNDHTILAGNRYGSVYFSQDNGLVFEPLPFDVAEPPFTGNITVAFDVDFSQNQTVYAADDAAGKGLYRFVIGESISWESIDTSLPDEARIGAIAVSDEGVLYALNLQPVANAGIAGIKGGMERSLNAIASIPDFMTVVSGLEEGISLKKLWLQENNLWTVDTLNNKLLTYADSLVAPINLISPADDAAGVNSDNVTLYWQAVDGAAVYQWQIDKAADFFSIEDQGYTTSSQITLTDLDKDSTYCWRIRAVEPVVSPWSTIWTFNTLKLDAPALSQPGSSGTTPIEPLFRWSLSEGAEQYQLLVSLDDQFNTLAIDRLCNANVWQCNIALQNATSYYWKVRAQGGQILSDWSAVSLFTTEAAPTPTPTPGLNSPSPSSPVSSTSASIEPVFRWSAVDGADQYELVVSKDDSFQSILIDQICNANTWVCDTTLAYQTAYYWKVRALKGEMQSDWSDVGAFTTKVEPSNSSSGGADPPPKTTLPTPSPSLIHTSTPAPSVTQSHVTNVPSIVPATSSTTLATTAITVIYTTSPENLPASTIKAVPFANVSTSTASAALSPKPADTIQESPAGSNGPILYIMAVLMTISIGASIFVLKKKR